MVFSKYQMWAMTIEFENILKTLEGVFYHILTFDSSHLINIFK